MLRKANIEPRNLTVDECRTMLSEKLHRNTETDQLKERLSEYVCTQIDAMLRYGRTSGVFDFSIENPWFQRLKVKISVGHGKNLDQRRMCSAQYYNGSGLDRENRLENPEMSVTVQVSSDGWYPKQWLVACISHEVTHLYDDWKWMNLGHESLCVSPKHTGAAELMAVGAQYGIHLLGTIGFGCYLSAQSEENAFIGQVCEELAMLSATRRNIHKKLKATSSYRNYRKFTIDLKHHLSECDESTAKTVNDLITNWFNKSGVPCVKGRFDFQEFSSRMVKWSENVRMHFMKRYCGAVQYYLDLLKSDRTASGII